MAQTYDLIATETLSVDGNFANMTSIPSTFTDLILIAFLKGFSGAGLSPYLRFNSDGSAIYGKTELRANGTTVTQGVNPGGTYLSAPGPGMITASAGFVHIQIASYANTGKLKTVVMQAGQGDGQLTLAAGVWASTAAINAIVFAVTSGFILAGSKISLYGVKSA